MASVIFAQNNFNVVLGTTTVGPFVIPAGNGFKVSIRRVGLPAGRAEDGIVLKMTPWFSFDNQATWKQKAGLWLGGGVLLDKFGQPHIWSSISWPWEKELDGTPMIPTNVKAEIEVFVAATLDRVVVETL